MSISRFNTTIQTKKKKMSLLVVDELKRRQEADDIFREIKGELRIELKEGF